MGVKLEHNLDTICVLDLKAGVLAEIVEWDEVVGTVGKIVQRWNDDLVEIGSPDGWSCFFHDTNDPLEYVHCRVRILTPGEKIIVEKN